MDPNPSTPNVGPEPTPSRVPESQPISPGTPEKAPEAKPERKEASPEQARPAQGISLPPVQPPPVAPAPTPVAPAKDGDDAQTPLIADDVDVIEMEWVNQAKKVIKETQDDPHAQEAAVEKLQRDYLKKRFGKDIKVSADA